MSKFRVQDYSMRGVEVEVEDAPPFGVVATVRIGEVSDNDAPFRNPTFRDVTRTNRFPLGTDHKRAAFEALARYFAHEAGELLRDETGEAPFHTHEGENNLAIRRMVTDAMRHGPV